MAVNYHCEICEEKTLHTVQSGCLKCREKAEEEYDKYWAKQSRDTQILDLYKRIKAMERQRSFTALD